jgi:plasmid replication initiation protein
MPKSDLVVKSNQVIEASYTLSTIEQRLILSAIAQIPKGEPVTDEEIYTVSVTDLQKFGAHEITAYRDLRESVSRLFERSIVLRSNDRTSRTRWVQKIDFMDSRGVIGIRFSKDILPFLSNLSLQFTKYLASDLIGVTSTYAIRLYELLVQYRTIGKREISVADLRWMFELQNKYPVWADLKRWVIDQAIKEINEFSPLSVTYETKKTGRKITHIQLKFKQKPQQAQIATETQKIDHTRVTPLKPLTEPQIAKYSAILCKLGSLSELAGTMDYPTFANWLGNVLRSPENGNQETVKRVFKALRTETDYSKLKT